MRNKPGASTMVERSMVKRTSSAVRSHSSSRSPSPRRRNSKHLKASAAVENQFSSRGVVEVHRFVASTVLGFLLILWAINVFSFVTEPGRYTTSIGQQQEDQTSGQRGLRISDGDNDEDDGESMVQTRDVHDTEKEPILQLLRDAGIHEVEHSVMESLPTWEQVTALYGAEPVLVGLDTCQAFRESGEDPAEHLLGVGGTFNSGTNLLAELLIHNCEMRARQNKFGAVNQGIRWQVPWGKHTPVDDERVRQGHKTQSGTNLTANEVFPAITIRDPAVWAASMCRHEYSMEWTHTKKGEQPQHCPNFVPNEIDVALNATLQEASSVPVRIEYAEFTREHDSLLHHWNDYYGAYLRQDRFPRLMVRFEDLIFHPKQVTEAVCLCAGGEMKHALDGKGFQYIVQSAKKGAVHGKDKTGYVDAIVKYGTDKNRWRSGGMTDADRKFADRYLDRELMKLFAYKLPEMESAAAES